MRCEECRHWWSQHCTGYRPCTRAFLDDVEFYVTEMNFDRRERPWDRFVGELPYYIAFVGVAVIITAFLTILYFEQLWNRLYN